MSSIVEGLLRSGFPTAFLLLSAFAVVAAALLLFGILFMMYHEHRVRR